MTLREKAYLVAERAHINQNYDIFPYMYHVRQVTKVAEDLGFEEDIIVACILHDVLEDTPLSYNDVKTIFGVEIADIVFCVTDELGRNRKERKLKTFPKIKENWKAAVVKICDRIANIKHSKEFNPGMFKMYLGEMGDFRTIKSIEHPIEIDVAWEELENLIKF